MSATDMFSSTLRALDSKENEFDSAAPDDAMFQETLAALDGPESKPVRLRPLAELPEMRNPDFEDVDATAFEQRLFYDAQSPEDKARFDFAASGGDAKYAVARTVASERASLSFPEDDLEQAVRDITPGGNEKLVKWLTPHAAKMASTPDGKKRLEKMWHQARLGALEGKERYLLGQFSRGEIDGDFAVAAADWKRGLEDRYGGKFRVAYNLAGDAAYSAGRTTVSMGMGVLQAVADWNETSPETTADALEALHNHPLLGADMRVGTEATLAKQHIWESYAPIMPGYRRANQQVADARHEAEGMFYRPRSQTGNYLVDKVFQPVAEGIGSTAPSLAAWLTNPALGIASSYGAGYAEVSDAMPDADDGTRIVTASVGALLYTALDFASVDAITKGWKSFSPGRRWVADSVVKPFFGEAVNEGGQAGVSAIAAEINDSLRPGYEFQMGRFLARAVPNMLEEGFFGGLTGAVMGAGGSRPVRAFVKEHQWRAGQRMIDSGVEKLAKSEMWKKDPAKAKATVEGILDRAGAPRIMYQAAEEVQALFQGRPEALEKYLAAVDVTASDFSHAVNSGSDVEISVSGLIRYQTEPDAHPDARKLARPTPDAPTIGAIAEGEQAKRDMLAEYGRIQKANEPLSEPFAIFRQQLLDAGHDVALANYETDMLLAGARVAGKRQGLTPQQFLNLNPIQVVLQNGLRKARSAGEVAGEMEFRSREREVAAAQKEITRYQAERKGRYDFMPAPNGSVDFGKIVLDAMDADKLKGAGMESGPVRLERGNRHFGKLHIEKNHADALAAVHATDAEGYVKYVMDNYTEIRTGENGRFILLAEGEDKKVAVLNLHKGDDNYYTVTTGYLIFKGKKKPGELLWDGSNSSSRDSGDPARLLSPQAAETGGKGPLRNDGQSNSPNHTIPVDPADVNLFDKEILATLMAQAGVKPEQAQAFAQYAQALLDQGGDLQDADALAREVGDALEYAEGYEQAAAGLERILVKPEEITRTILDAMGIEAESLQEGIAAIREKMGELSRQAEAWRNFYQNPEMIQKLRGESAREQAMTGDARVRGSISFRPNAAVIRLFNSRQDRSTVVHELFHYFYRELETAAKKGDADPAALRDYLILNEAAGGGLASTDESARAAAEEKVAAMWEKYLMEGVAPSPRLAAAFARFRTWLTSIYRNVAAMGEVNLADDARGVFDRLIAAEEEIAAAREYYNDKEQFRAPDVGTESQRGDLADKAERARRSTEDLHVSRIVKEHIKAIGGRAAFRTRAREEVRQQPAYRLIQALKDMGGMTREDAAAEVGDVMAEAILKKHRGVIGEKVNVDGKIDALIEAENFGYDSLRDMLTEIAAAPAYRDAVTARVELMVAMEEAEVRRLALEDAATPADEAYHNDAFSDYLAAKQRVLDAEAERQALADGRRAERMLSDRALRDLAAEHCAGKRGNRAGQYHVEVNAFKRHGENAMKAERAKDYIAAARELRYQRLAHYGIREALKARLELERFEDHNGVRRVLQRLDGERGKPRVEFAFREAIKDILTTFKVTKSALLNPERAVGPEVAIPGHSLDPETEALLPALSEAIPAWIVKREGAGSIKNWKDLTLGQIRELDQALRALEDIGRGELSALRFGQIQTIEQLKNDSINRMLSRKGDNRPRIYDGKTLKDKFLDSLDKLGVGALIPEYILAMADGNTGITGKGVGPLQHAAVRFRACLGRKSSLVNASMARIAPALKAFQGFRKRFGKIDPARFGQFPESLRTGRNRTAWDAETVLMLALNSGNAGNLKAMLEGYGIGQAQWQAIASTLTETEWLAVQTVWDAIGEYHPLIDEVTFRQVNRHVRKVEAQPFTVLTADGKELTLDGGYFPLIYDSLADPDVERGQEIEVAMNRAHAQAIHGFARIADNFTQSRRIDEETGEPVSKRPPLLDYNLITTHLDKVAHYVALADAVREFDRLTLDEEWARVFTDRFGKRYYDMIRQYVKGIADPDSGNSSSSGLRDALEWLRHKATTAALGLRFWTGIKQRLDYFPAALHMSLHSRTGASGFKYLVKGMREIGWKGNLGAMNAKIEEIFRKSEVMRDRDGNVTADMREMLSKVRGDQRGFNLFGHEFTRNDVNNAFFFWIQMNDRAAASAVWLGSYTMALDGNGSFDPAGMTAEEIETAAVRDADMAAATLASSTAADLTAWQRDKGMARLFTTFLSGTVRRTSRMRQYVDALRQGQITKGQFLKNFIVDAALQSWLPAFLYMGMKGLTGDDDDQPSMWDFFSTLFLDPITTVADGVPFFNMFNSARQYGARGAFMPASLGLLEKQARNAFAIPGDIEKGDYGKALWKAALIGTAAAGIPVESPVRDVEKTLRAVGVVEKTKGR